MSSSTANGDPVCMNLPCGEGELCLTVPAANLLGVIRPGEAGGDAGTARRPRAEDEQQEIDRALGQPIGTPRLRDLAAGKHSAAIVISDVTRPCPSYKFLPALLDELQDIGDDNIVILGALGSHRRHTDEERRRLVGDEVFRRVRVLDLDSDDCVDVGTTSAGTPLEVFRPYLDAELRVCTGNIEYHYFAGYSGGAKAVMPGICSRSAIQPNHSRMLHPKARAGILDGNPVREDIDEGGGIVGIDFILNVILDEKKRVLGAVAGHYLEAHREGVRRFDALFDITIPAAADVVVASPGGHPKDLNLYQAQKTLDNVRPAVREGGTIILAARCGEGFGSEVFESWMLDMSEPRLLIERIQQEFVLGGHKAAAIADLLLASQVYLVSSFPDDVVRRMGMHPYHDLDGALAAALARQGEAAKVLVVPYGNRVRALSR
jgi:nickel-dependent lactate racemase